METIVVTPMPVYQCHKKVAALKIAEIRVEETPDRILYLVPVEEGFASIAVTEEWCDKHKPEVGGYYVVYEDGYASYSPAGAFESGYTLI